MAATMLTREAMLRAMLAGDRSCDGVFYTGVRAAGSFCRPSCSARQPLPEALEFFPTADDALAAGYRPCLHCTSLRLRGATPEWVTAAVLGVEREPRRWWTDEDLRERGWEPERLRRWFREEFGTTFHAHIRARRLALALGALIEDLALDDAAADDGCESLRGSPEAEARTLGTTPGKVETRRLLVFRRLVTPLGPMLAMAEPDGVVLLEFVDRPALPREVEELRSRYGYAVAPGTNPHLDLLERELAAYFAGAAESFTVSLVLPATVFQRRVWEGLRAIPYGETTSYGALARELGSPGASRAVGLANGQNRLAIVIPCHRVIGADGSLTGYGGGQPRKASLLALERKSRSAAGVPEQTVLFAEAT